MLPQLSTLLAMAFLAGCPLQAQQSVDTDSASGDSAGDSGQIDSANDSGSDDSADDSGGDDSGPSDSGDCTEQIYYFDDDSDGYGNGEITILECVQPAGYVANPDDCDDNNADISPAGIESCNSADDDCDSQVDEEGWDAPTWYADVDEDGRGDPAISVESCTAIPGTVADSSDCDDNDAFVNIDAAESCNGIDDNCDGDIDEDSAIDALAWHADGDGDTFGDPTEVVWSCSQPIGTVAESSDCDDLNATTHPGADEHCDETDEDCDGTVDDNAVDKPTWWADLDADGYGGSSLSFADCAAPTGYVATSTDCNDTTPDISPAADELCGGTDENCDGTIDEDSAMDAVIWYADTDSDGHGDIANNYAACTVPTGFTDDATDCNDTDAEVSPTDLERCGGADENCDGNIDEDSAVDAPIWYADNDADAYGDANNTYASCLVPSGYLADSNDCDDAANLTNPLGIDECGNSLDEDCADGPDDQCFELGARMAADSAAVVTASEGYSFGYFGAGGVDLDGVEGVELLTTEDAGSSSRLWAIRADLEGSWSPTSDIATYQLAVPAPGGIGGIGAGDLDGDGIGEIIVSATDSTYVRSGPLLGQDGTFGPEATLNGSGLVTGGSFVQDFDDDGDNDLATALQTSSAIPYALVINNLWTGTRSWNVSDAGRSIDAGAVATYGCGGRKWGQPSGGEDYDGDGISDLLLHDGSHDACTRAYLLLGPITGTADMATDAAWTLEAQPEYPSPSTIGRSAHLAKDVEGDGLADILIGGEEYGSAWPEGIVLLFAGGTMGSVSELAYTAHFSPSNSDYTYFGHGLGSADLDGDARSEIVIGGYDAAAIWFGSVSGTHTDLTADVTITDEAYSYMAHSIVNMGDVEGFGFDTIAMGAPFHGDFDGAVYFVHGGGR